MCECMLPISHQVHAQDQPQQLYWAWLGGTFTPDFTNSPRASVTSGRRFRDVRIRVWTKSLRTSRVNDIIFMRHGYAILTNKRQRTRVIYVFEKKCARRATAELAMWSTETHQLRNISVIWSFGGAIVVRKCAPQIDLCQLTITSEVQIKERIFHVIECNCLGACLDSVYCYTTFFSKNFQKLIFG